MKRYEFAKKKIMTPGPVPLPAVVKNSFAQYECHHRTKEFQVVLESVFEKLKSVFQTKQHCFLLSSTGTGAMEAALINTCKQDSKILTINAGKFGERWGKIAKAFKLEHHELKLPWGQDIDLNQVEDQLKNGSFHGLAFQACETSTGALLPVEELTKLAKKYNALSIVDGITALGAVDLPMDQLELDVFIGGSQKAFMLPTGLSFISLSERAEQVESDLPKYYFNLIAEKKANLSGKTQWSTPSNFVLALDAVLEQIVNEVGLKNHFDSIQKKADFFREKVQLDLYPATSSPSLTCLKVPEGLSGNTIKSKVAEAGYIIMGGQDQLNDRVLRVGHMGEMSFDDLENTANAINRFL